MSWSRTDIPVGNLSAREQPLQPWQTDWSDDGHETRPPRVTEVTAEWGEALLAGHWVPVPYGYARCWSHTGGYGHVCLCLHFHDHGAWAIIEDGSMGNRVRINIATCYTLEQVFALWRALEATSFRNRNPEASR